MNEGNTTETLTRNISRYAGVSVQDARDVVSSAGLFVSGKLSPDYPQEVLGALSGSSRDMALYGLYAYLSSKTDNPLRSGLTLVSDWEPLFRREHPFRSIRRAQLIATALEWIYDGWLQRYPPRPVDLAPEVTDLLRGLSSPLTDGDVRKLSTLLEERARSVDTTTRPADFDVIMTLFMANADSNDSQVLTRLIGQLHTEGRDHAAVFLESTGLSIIEGMTSTSVWQPWLVERFDYWSNRSGGPPMNYWLGALTTPELAAETRGAFRDGLIKNQGKFHQIMPVIVGLLVFDDPEWRRGTGPTCTPFRSIIDRTSEVFSLTDSPRAPRSTNQ